MCLLSLTDELDEESELEMVKPRVTLADPTPAAYIGYRVEKDIKEADSNEPQHWNLYTAPFTLAAGETLRTRAIRYGYRESQITTVILK